VFAVSAGVAAILMALASASGAAGDDFGLKAHHQSAPAAVSADR
jgi:hypothetical protein